MTWLRRLFRHTNTFHGQQRLVIMLACSIVLFASLGSTMIYDTISFNRDSRTRLGALADIIAADISTALVFGDTGAINKTLQSLEADPDITQLFILNVRSEVSGWYIRGSRQLTPSDIEQRMKQLRSESSQSFFKFSHEVSRPIIHDGEQLGSIIVEPNSKVFTRRLLVSGSIGTLILLLSVLGSYLLAGRFGQIVNEPVQLLVTIMEEVTKTKNYRMRAEVNCVAELAMLSDGFNKMLGEIAQRDETLLERQEYLHKMANYDSLTGLANRSLFNDRMATALRCAERTGERLAVLFIDLDDFKAINDNNGHRIGDLLLIEVSRRLERETRAGDTVARLGGDEFMIFLQAVKSADDAMTVASKHLNNLQAAYLLEDKHLFVSASIGIALFPDHGATAEALVISADAAMYHAKEKGKNHLTISTHASTDLFQLPPAETARLCTAADTGDI